MQTKHETHVDVAAERKLWTAVIAATIEEWVSGPLRLSIEADKYLFDKRSDFESVCQDAGLDAAALRDRLNTMKKAGLGPSALMMPRTILRTTVRGSHSLVPFRAA